MLALTMLAAHTVAAIAMITFEVVIKVGAAVAAAAAAVVVAVAVVGSCEGPEARQRLLPYLMRECSARRKDLREYASVNTNYIP